MSLDLAAALDVPLLTADLPGVGGRIKSQPEDFEVEEIPAYEPSGTGDFLYLWVEKRGMGAEYFTRQIARRLGISIGQVGTAGLKDRHAVTRQWVSVPAAAQPRLAELEGEGIRLLGSSRHGNKLRPGHLRGNRFRVVIRDLDKNVEVPSVVNAVINRLCEAGLPNFYGPQRFGKAGETLLLGLKFMGAAEAGAGGGSSNGVATRNRFLRKLAMSAVQSALFNRYLALRMQDGLLRRVLRGDVMCKWPTGGMFVAEDIDAEQERFDRREIVNAGPIFGKKTFAAKGDAAEREAGVLSEVGLTAASFRGAGKLLIGGRRHNLVYVADLKAELQLGSVQLTFTLPAGSYATVLLSEIMKVWVPEEEVAAPD